MAAGCASGPQRPPVPISQGGDRAPVEPTTGSTDTGDGVDTGDLGDVDGGDTGEPETDTKGEDGGYTPAFLGGEEVQRAAVLLPFSHSNSKVRNEAEGMLAAIELALFEQGAENFILLPKDTAGRSDIAEMKTKEAIEEGADIIIGPLFGGNVQPVTKVARKKRVPVVSFSNDRRAAGGGAYLISLAPEEEVARVVEYASRLGVRSYAFLGPDTDYGRQIETALSIEASRNGGRVIASRKYSTDAEDQKAAAKDISSLLKAESRAAPGKVAVMIPEQGVKLRGVAPLLPYNGVDLRRIKVLGTGFWNDPSVWREPVLYGGLFAAPSPEDGEAFEQTYRRIYGRAPQGLASLGYDAAALALQLAGEDKLTSGGVTDRDGFIGTNGLFRFRYDGTAERGLSVLEITPEGVVVAEPGKRDFDGGRGS